MTESSDDSSPAAEPSTAADGHLTYDALAELAEGLLPAAEATAAQAHLDGCVACAADRAVLAELPAALAAMAHLPIPASIAARIDSALAAEATARTSPGTRRADVDEPLTMPPSVSPAAVSASSSPVGSPVSSLAAARERRSTAERLRRAGAALVGVAAVLGGGFLFGDALLSSGDDQADHAESPAAGAAGATDSGGDESSDGAAPSLVETDSGIAYTDATLLADVQSLLAAKGVTTLDGLTSPQRSESSREENAEDSDLYATVPGAEQCVEAVLAYVGSAAQPLAVDVATFDGSPAVIVVVSLPRSADADAEALVASASCLEPDSGALEILDREPVTDVPGGS